MNYYDEIIQKINDLIEDKEYEEAKRLIINELNISYVPKDVEKHLNELLQTVNSYTYKPEVLSDEKIIEYLYDDNDHQLIAINELDKKNLRDYLDICKEYLVKGTYNNAQVLLIDSLIRQEINCDFEFKGKNFNPSKISRPEESEGYISALTLLQERFMKEPSMLKLAMGLLYKEVMFALPHTLNKQEGINAAEKIISYILKAFESAN